MYSSDCGEGDNRKDHALGKRNARYLPSCVCHHIKPIVQPRLYVSSLGGGGGIHTSSCCCRTLSTTNPVAVVHLLHCLLLMCITAAVCVQFCRGDITKQPENVSSVGAGYRDIYNPTRNPETKAVCMELY